MFVKIMEPKKCNLCGSDMLFKEGVSSKTNKPYKGYFCSDKKDCGNVEWIKTSNSSSFVNKPARNDLNASGNDKISIANEMMLKLDELVRGQKIIMDLLQKRDDEDISGVPFK